MYVSAATCCYTYVCMYVYTASSAISPLAPHTRTIATFSGCLPSGLGKSSSGSSTWTDCTVRPALVAHLAQRYDNRQLAPSDG